MLRYLISRIVSMIPLLVVITAFTFIIGQYGAGDLAAYLAGTRGDAAKGFDVELYQQFREELGMDDPILVRYGNWLWNALHGDFGRSYVMMGDPEISYLLANSVPQSLQLVLAALVVEISPSRIGYGQDGEQNPQDINKVSIDEQVAKVDILRRLPLQYNQSTQGQNPDNDFTDNVHGCNACQFCATRRMHIA